MSDKHQLSKSKVKKSNLHRTMSAVMGKTENKSDVNCHSFANIWLSLSVSATRHGVANPSIACTAE
jgi:hypothetical protein